MTDERTEAHNVSLYPSDWRDVERIAQETGIRSTSAALRLILQEWRQIRAMYHQLENHYDQTNGTEKQNPAPAV